MVKVFTLNKDGKIELTKDELEKALNEAWEDGRTYGQYYYWHSPTITYPTITYPTITYPTFTCSSISNTTSSANTATTATIHVGENA